MEEKKYLDNKDTINVLSFDLGSAKNKIGYLYDFQHKNLPNLFVKEETEYRDKNFKEILNKNSTGSLDDLLEFYSSFSNMNLKPSEKGLEIKKDDKGWFNSNYINFKYRLKNRKFIIPWMYAVSRSITLIDGIRNHDWLRRRAGILESLTKKYYIPVFKNLFKIFLKQLV